MIFADGPGIFKCPARFLYMLNKSPCTLPDICMAGNLNNRPFTEKP